MHPLLALHPLGGRLNHADDDFAAALQADPHHLLGHGQAQLHQLVPALEDHLLPGQGGLFQKVLDLLFQPGGGGLTVPDRVAHGLGGALSVAVPVALVPGARPNLLLLLHGLFPGPDQKLLRLLPSLVQNQLSLELGVVDGGLRSLRLLRLFRFRLRLRRHGLLLPHGNVHGLQLGLLRGKLLLLVQGGEPEV